MSPKSTVSKASGAVADALRKQVSEEVRQHGIVVWLDKDGAYNDFVDRLRSSAESFRYPIVAFRGSFLEFLLDLDGKMAGQSKPALLVHMPGFSEDRIAESPALEVYRAGRRFRVALDTLLRDAAGGQVAPAAIDAKVKTGVASLEDGDAWLKTQLAGDDVSRPKLPVADVVGMFDALARGGVLEERVNEPAMLAVVRDHLARTLGIDDAWWEESGRGHDTNPEHLRAAMSGIALCTEFVHDLKRKPLSQHLVRLADLPSAVVENCRRLSKHLRTSHPEVYEQEADDLEERLAKDVQGATAADLGQVDTFRFEDRTVFSAAVGALAKHSWEEVLDYSKARALSESFWVTRDPDRRTAWGLVQAAAELGAACSRNLNLLSDAHDHSEAAERYANGGFEVDLAQRRFEQRRADLALIKIDELAALRRGLDVVREVYRAWADDLAETFNALCKDRGYLPEPALQQRTLFDRVVKPEAKKEKTAYFMVDALRFEMAHQLAQSLESSGRKPELQFAYAELPSVTEVGMNVLAPVAKEGRLEPVWDGSRIKGFSAGVRIHSPETRRKAMHEAIGGETCPLLSLEKVLDDEPAKLKRRIARARLVVVHSIGIDKAGELGVGLRHFEDELRRIKAVWSKLLDAGIRRFVLTSDHGFLLQDETTRREVKEGRVTDSNRRHVIRPSAADEVGKTRVSTSELLYDGAELQVVMPASSQPFEATPRKDFLHGGNSLQERLIPVLIASYSHAPGKDRDQYQVTIGESGLERGLHVVAGKLTTETSHVLFPMTEINVVLESFDDEDASVVLVEAEGARLEAGSISVPVAREFRIFFRLTGPTVSRTRVAFRAAHTEDTVIGKPSIERFSVELIGSGKADSGDILPDGEYWLEQISDVKVRRILAHIQEHGAINESDATEFLGGGRQFRRFSRDFETYAKQAPFGIRVDASSGAKRYVREDE